MVKGLPIVINIMNEIISGELVWLWLKIWSGILVEWTRMLAQVPPTSSWPKEQSPPLFTSMPWFVGYRAGACLSCHAWRTCQVFYPCPTPWGGRRQQWEVDFLHTRWPHVRLLPLFNSMTGNQRQLVRKYHICQTFYTSRLLTNFFYPKVCKLTFSTLNDKIA